VTHFVEQYGLWVVFAVVLIEVAGLPFIPGETALIAASVLASQGHGSIVWTIVLAIAAAVLGAGIGYAVGRRWGRGLLRVSPWLERVTKPGVERSDEFFRRHGTRAVVLGRFVPVLRATLGWMAGVGRMPFLRFLIANVAGAVAWGLAIGLVSYYVGGAVIRFGTYAIAGAVALIIAVWLVRRNRA
jgi:membrane protein DedA with SNARE-associated domain